MTDGEVPPEMPAEGGRRHRGSKKSRGTRKTRKGTRKQSKWMQHVMATKRANKGKDLTEVLKMASETYKKGGNMEGGSDSIVGGIASGASAVGGGKKTRKAKKSRKY